MKISITETGLLQALTSDYLNNKPELRPFYHYPISIESIEIAIKNKKASYRNREVLVEVLHKQYKSVTPKEAVATSITALSSDNTFTITTAHQPNLFGGPLYFVVKILSAISTARHLKSIYPAYNFVPVYWMGSEDHDAAELNNISLYNSKIEWAAPGEGAFGRLPTTGLSPLIDEILNLFEGTLHRDAAERLLKECYLEQPTIAAATRALVNTLFGKYGVITIDGDDVALKSTFKDVIKEELLNASSKPLADNSSKGLESLGYIPQAFARPINLFYLDNNVRSRIEVDGDNYTVLQTDKKFTKEEIGHLADTSPEMFSPNVILRGLYQESVLPNLIFIGGGAEVSYWLQLKKVFEYHHVTYPMVMLRDSALILESSFLDKWGALGFEINDLFKDETLLIKDFMDRQTDMAYTDYASETGEIAKAFESIKQKIALIDKTLMPATEAEFVKVKQIVDGLSNRGAKALKRRYDQSIQSIKNNKQKYFPAGVLQERHYNFLQWYVRYGTDWFDLLLEDFNPFDKALTIITL